MWLAGGTSDVRPGHCDLDKGEWLQSGQHVAWHFGDLQRKLLEAGKAESACTNVVVLPEALSCALPGTEQASQVRTDGVPDLIWPHSESGCARGHPAKVPPSSTHRPSPGRHPGTAGVGEGQAWGLWLSRPPELTPVSAGHTRTPWFQLQGLSTSQMSRNIL